MSDFGVFCEISDLSFSLLCCYECSSLLECTGQYKNRVVQKFRSISRTLCLGTNVADRDMETDRDLETYMDLEHPVEPQNPAFNRPSHHTSDQAPPKIYMVPTDRAKSDREEAIQIALEWRDQENMPFDDLCCKLWHWHDVSGGVDICLKSGVIVIFEQSANMPGNLKLWSKNTHTGQITTSVPKSHIQISPECTSPLISRYQAAYMGARNAKLA